MSIKDWPDEERPREKLLRLGANSLSDAELLAIFLRTGTRGKTALDLSRELLKQFINLRQLLSAKEMEFTAIDGLGKSKYAQLMAAVELAKRELACDLKNGPELNHSRQVKHYLRAELRGYQQEVFACLFLDQKHRVIAFEKLFYGTINQASVYPREIVKRVLYHNAAAIIFAHNHPSGNPQPSQADREITHLLHQALSLIEVRVLDHLVIGDQEVVSLAELGWLEPSG